MIARGRLLGIARHAYRRAPMEVIDEAVVTLAGGIAGDNRGGIKGRPHRRQVTLMELSAWQAALAEIGADVPWQERRVNLLVDARLPRHAGPTIRIGADVLLRVTCECDPCHRMDAVAPGLFPAMVPDWRGGVCAEVVTGGRIARSDIVAIEESWPGLSERSTTSAISAAGASSSART